MAEKKKKKKSNGKANGVRLYKVMLPAIEAVFALDEEEVDELRNVGHSFDELPYRFHDLFAKAYADGLDAGVVQESIELYLLKEEEDLPETVDSYEPPNNCPLGNVPICTYFDKKLLNQQIDHKTTFLKAEIANLEKMKR
jgi:hypothetical protein